MQLLALPLGCELRHQDGGAHQSYEDAPEHQEALPDKSGLLVRPGGARGGEEDAGCEAPGHPDRRRRTAPIAQDHGLCPYIAKIKASGADSVITGNWGQDFALLLKAAADAGLQVDWYTYYAGGAGGPTAIKQTGLSHRVFQISEGVPNSAPEAAQKWEADFRAKLGVSL